VISDFLRWLLDSSGFMARRYCGPAWTAEMVQASLFANVTIFWCYVYLSAAAIAVWRLRLQLTLPAGVLCWAFILSCGFTHWTQARMFFDPAYRLDIAAQLVCATFSLATVTYLTASCVRQLRERRACRI
jgi:hypothetical protein